VDRIRETIQPQIQIEPHLKGSDERGNSRASP